MNPPVEQSIKLEYEPKPEPSRLRIPAGSEIAYILPMAVFMVFTWAGGNWPAFFPYSYALKTIVVAILLAILWKHYTKIRWTHLGLGVVVGVIGVVQWVGMEKLLLLLWPDYPRLSAETYDPTKEIVEPWLRYSFIAVRLLGATLLVPVMEELFWRDYLWRTIAAPNDFKLADVGEYDRTAFFVVPLVFAMVHIQWLTAIGWGLLIAWLLIRTRSLGACIVAHGVTNFLLGAYVLFSHYVLKRDEWYFW